MKKGTIVTLDDDSEYALLDETIVNNQKFFFGVKVDKDGNPTTSYEVFLEVLEDGEYYLDTLEDGDYKQAILIDFTNNYLNSVQKYVDEKNNQ